MEKSSVEVCRLFTQYAALMHSERNFLLSAIVLSYVFEKYITEKAGIESGQENALYRSVEILDIDGSLHCLRQIRNRVIHNNTIELHYPEYSKRFLQFFKIELSMEKIDNFTSYERTRIFEQLKAYDFFKEGRECTDKFVSFSVNDFFDLYIMKEKFLRLRSTFKKDKFLKKLNLDSEKINRVDGTSGYVWLPLKGVSDDPEYKYAKPTLSMLATIDSFRIYVDFGGQSLYERIEYYKLFDNDEFLELLEDYSNKFQDFYLFNIEWYFNIVEKYKIDEDHFLENLDQRKDFKKRAIQDLQEKKVVTWNKMLCGFIIQRREISYSEICDHIHSLQLIFKIVCERIER